MFIIMESIRKTIRTFVAGTTSAFVGRQRASEVHHLAIGQKAELRQLDAWDSAWENHDVNPTVRLFFDENPWENRGFLGVKTYGW